MIHYALAIISIVILIIIAVLILIQVLQLKSNPKDFIEKKKELQDLVNSETRCRIQLEKVKYTEAVLQFIRDFISEFVVLKFKTFEDNSYVEKVTKTTLENFIKETAQDIRSALYDKQIDYDSLLVTDSYVDSYIVDTCIIITKGLFSKSLENSDDIDLDINSMQ